MRDYKVIALGPFVTARETLDGKIMLVRPSDETEAGHYIPANEIYLSRIDLKQIAEAFLSESTTEVIIEKDLTVNSQYLSERLEEIEKLKTENGLMDMALMKVAALPTMGGELARKLIKEIRVKLGKGVSDG